jgi:hypothetical protein
MAPVYDLSWILPYVRDSMKDRGNLNFESFVDGLLAALARANVPTIQKSAPPQSTRRPYNLNAIHQDIQIAITESFYYVEQNRFILQQPHDNSLSITQGGQWLITKRGVEWANGVDPLPEDYNGYMKQLGPTTDAIVRQYVSEALNTFMKEAYFACAVMIGAASEKTIYLLADSMVPALSAPSKKTELTNRIGARKMEKLLQYVEEMVNEGHKRKIIPFDVMGGTVRHLVSIFDHIRLQRNDAIHPMNFVVSADSVRAALIAFPMAFEKVDALRQWCHANPGSL